MLFVDIPLRLILTKVDQLDLCTPGDLSGIFKSKQMADKVRLAKGKIRAPRESNTPNCQFCSGNQTKHHQGRPGTSSC